MSLGRDLPFLRRPCQESNLGDKLRRLVSRATRTGAGEPGAFRRCGRAACVVVVTVLAYGSSSALAAHPPRRKSPAAPWLVSVDLSRDWPLCEESNLANRVRSPMPGRRDRENRDADRSAARERHRAVLRGAGVVMLRWQARPPRRVPPKKHTGRQISPASPAGFEPAFPDRESGCLGHLAMMGTWQNRSYYREPSAGLEPAQCRLEDGCPSAGRRGHEQLLFFPEEPTGNRTRTRGFADHVPRQRSGSRNQTTRAVEENRTPIPSLARSDSTTELPPQNTKRATGIEPASTVWKTVALPLDDARERLFQTICSSCS